MGNTVWQGRNGLTAGTHYGQMLGRRFSQNNSLLFYTGKKKKKKQLRMLRGLENMTYEETAEGTSFPV